MSRLTGTDTKGLMEAYSAVYAPQELTEEQVWEEVETWVNSLLEEGYDLSEYTWEEMYESYLEELTDAQKNTKIKSELNAANTELIKRGGVAGSIGRGLTSMFGSQKDIDKNKASDKASDARVRQAGAASVGKYYSSSDGKTYANYNDAKAAKNSRDAKTAAKPPATKPPAATPAARTPAGTPPTRTPAATPAAKVAPTKPAAPAKPATGMLGKTSFERRTPTSAEFKAAARERAGGEKSPEKILQAAKSASAPTPAVKPVTPAAAVSAAPSTSAATSGSLAPATAKVATKPSSAMSQDSIRARRLNMGMEYDAYDLVLEYLFSQGHAETVEEAHYIMTEMDAETIGTIVEAAADQSDKQIDKGVKTTYKAQNVLDNQHQGRSKGLNKLPRGEREDKTKRMRGRLKNRRDDLFGERNKREDSRRDELKKMLGL